MLTRFHRLANALFMSFSLPTWIVLAVVGLTVSTDTASADRARVDSLNRLGRGFIFSNVEEAVAIYGDAVAEARALGYPAGEARALQSRGVALYLIGQHEEGVEVTLQAIRLFEKLDLRSELALTYGDLGYQMKRRNLGRAMDFMRQGINIAETDADSVRLCTLYDNYGVLQEMADLPDSASWYYRRALDFKIALEDSLGIPFSLNNLSGIAAQQGRLTEARELLERSDEYRLAANDAYGLLQNKIQWAELSFMAGEFDTAAALFERALATPGMFENDFMARFCYERLAAIYEQKEDYEKAFFNQLRFSAYSDSLFNIENSARMATLELEFETEKKDRLLAESRLAMAARSRQILFLGATLVILVLSAVAIVRYQHLKRRQLQQEHAWRSRVRRAEYEQRMADEKLRISRELHDNIGAQLTFMTSSLDNIAHGAGPGAVQQGLDSISRFGRDTLGELRQTVWAMKSEGQGFEVLINKMQELKRQCSGTGRQVEFTSHSADETNLKYSSSRLLNVYRISQEAVQNAIKHTRNGPIVLHLAEEVGGLVLRVRDQGPGFAESEAKHVGGLAHMRQRCHDSGGEFEIDSSAEGTVIVCRFPPE